MGRGRSTTLLALLALMLVDPAAAASPSFECGEASGTVEELICADEALAALDRELADVWRQVEAALAGNPDAAMIRAEQRGWIKGRNDCWKSDDVRACVEVSYRERTAELQARWRLVPLRGPFFYHVADAPADEVVATFFDTDPPVAILERGDQSVVAFLQPAASGSRYVGGDHVFWVKGDEARVTWGWEAEELVMVLRQD
jgi:uncharacterized protein